MGLYPMLPGDTCIRLLACDFDDGPWREDATAYADVCREAGIDVLLEISRSGEGAHVWMFFDAPVSAEKARRAGALLLRRATCRSGSDDRLANVDEQVTGLRGIRHGQQDARAKTTMSPAAVQQRSSHTTGFLAVDECDHSGEYLVHATIDLLVPCLVDAGLFGDIDPLERDSGDLAFIRREAPALFDTVRQFRSQMSTLQSARSGRQAPALRARRRARVVPLDINEDGITGV